MKKENIVKEEVKKVATEAALIGYFKAKYQVELKLMSDEARQYHLFDHLACCVHAVRLLEKEIPYHQKSREQVDKILRHICKLYHHLKRHQNNPKSVLANRIEKCFDWITKKRTLSSAFNSALERFVLMKKDLLKVLKYPWVPLHNNLSESALREYVKRRKISAGTRSQEGRKARDLYCSLKQTCRKLGISFWQYLEDRLTKKNEIRSLSKILEEKLSAFCKCWPDLVIHGRP